MGVRPRNLLSKIFSRRENWIFIPVVIIILLLLFYSFYSVYLTTPSRSQLSIYSDEWSDLSKCRGALQNMGYEISSIISTPTILSKLNESKKKIYMAIGVERPYTSDEARAIWNFVQAGGNLILADDFGHGNTLWDKASWESVGNIEFERKQLFDPNYIKNTKFVTVNATFQGRPYNLLFNEPSAIRSETEYEVLASRVAMSSEASWLDDNGNGVRDPQEEKKIYELIVYMVHSEKQMGKVVVISDPGLFINDNYEMLDNWRFVQDLIADLLPTGGEIIFDESRHISQNTFENSRHIVYSGMVYITSSFWSIILISFLIISCTLIIGVKIKPQEIWRNRNKLDAKQLNILNYPYISGQDYWQMYGTFLEKVRLRYGFAVDEFRNLDQHTIFNLIGDRYLVDFIYQRFPVHPDTNYFAFINTP